MIRHYRVALLALFLLLPACTPQTKPPELFPGLESTPPESLATIRESNQTYLLKFDGKPAKEASFTLLGRDTSYRQYQVPAGQHDLVVYYDNGESNNSGGPGPGLHITVGGGRPGSLGLPDITLPANLQPGHTYSFTNGKSKFYLKFSSTSSTAKWNPTVIDDSTGKPATTQPTTTRP
jgi:hypothetical protein